MPTIFTINIPNCYTDIQRFVEKGILSFLDIIPKTEYISIYQKHSLELYSDNYKESLKSGWLTIEDNTKNVSFTETLTNIYQQILNQWGEDPDIHIILIATIDRFQDKDVSSMISMNFKSKLSIIILDTTSRVKYNKFNNLHNLVQKHRGYFKIINQIHDFNDVLQQLYRIYYKPYHCECICGNINLPLQIYPTLKEPLFPKVFSIIGFLTETDAPLPAYKSRYLLLPYEKQKNPLNTYQVIQKSLMNKRVYAIVTFNNGNYGYIHTTNDSSYMSLSLIPTLEQEVEVISKHDKSFKIPILQSETSYFKADLNLIPKIIRYIPELPKNQDVVLNMIRKIHYMSLVHQYPKIVDYVTLLLKNEEKKYQERNPNICNSLNEIISSIENDISNGSSFKSNFAISSNFEDNKNDNDINNTSDNMVYKNSVNNSIDMNVDIYSNN
ncbi:hypothetical protein BCR36DRAFT_416284, partial [Piromyces finnis]